MSNNRYHPQIDEEDVIISNGIPTIINAISHYRTVDKYIGFCMDKDDYDLQELIRNCNYLFETLNKNNNDYDYVLEHDTISSKGKELFLIRKNRKKYLSQRCDSNKQDMIFATK